MIHEPSDSLPDVALRLFRSAVQLVRVERGLGDARSSLRLPKLTALDTLARSKELTADQLAHQEGVTEPTILSTITHLARRRLVSRRRSRGSVRDRRLRVTKLGQQQLDRDRQRLAGLLEGLTDTERKTLQDAVTILERQLDDFYSREEEAWEGARQRVGIGLQAP